MSEAAATFRQWLKDQVEGEESWFHIQQLAPGLVTPGRSDPVVEKLPHAGLPEDLSGLRVLDIGCAEGFFSFEAERRGAAEVVAIDFLADVVRRFNICRAAFESKATAYLCDVYDLSARTFGTFDLVLSYGVLSHVRDPLLVLEKVRSVCTGTLLLETAVARESEATGPWARFHPHGRKSRVSRDGRLEQPAGEAEIVWLPNRECVRAWLEYVCFEEVEVLSAEDEAFMVLRAKSPEQAAGQAPDEMTAPWS